MFTQVHVIQIALSVLAYTIYLIVQGVLFAVVKRLALSKEIGEQRALAVRKGLRIILLLLLATSLGFIWGYDIQALLAASAGFFTLVGVAFFAVWSLLSNITSSIIIFFRFPMRIGDTIILPENDGINGRVEDITLFHILLIDDDGHTVAIPNNMIVQKILRIKRNRESEQGKGHAR